MKSNRQPLNEGFLLDIGNDKKYRILKLISDIGGSCLVYLANQLEVGQSMKYHNHEMQLNNSSDTKYIIKEFYPIGTEDTDLSQYISRDKIGKVVIAEEGLKLFNDEKIRFTGGIARQTAIFHSATNHSKLGCPEGYTNINGTAYSILKLENGVTLKEACYMLSVREITQIMLSICRAIISIHNRGQLYLDLKPDNVFLFNKEYNKSRQVAFFDFDTVFEKNNLPVKGFYSKGWSPIEQESWNIKKIGEATDVYTMGAVFYWLLTVGNKVTYDILELIYSNNFSFLNNIEILKGKSEAIRLIKEIMSSSLREKPSEREKNLGKFVNLFRELNTELIDNKATIENRTTQDKSTHYKNKQKPKDEGFQLYNRNIMKAIINNRNK